MLIQKGVNVNAANNDGKMTPLHLLVLFDSLRLYSANWTEEDSLSKFAQN